jgi:Fur family transcriptional regulator, ferric uptake regulator
MTETSGTTAVRRVTKQRMAVAAVLADQAEFRSAQELHSELRARGEAVGLTTVYRALQALADEGAVDVLRGDDGEAVYRRCTQTHHHHLVCRGCGRTIEVEAPQIERWADDIAGQHGFTAVTHTVEIFGLCPSCATAQSSA